MPAQSLPSALIPSPSKKIFYKDRLKVMLTILVILHHSLITYGASGNWYYTQKTTLMGALIPMTMFVAINQAFFMGFFFFLSAYFIGPSFERKRAARFVADRLLRLGIPLLFYSLILGPLMNYLVYYFGHGHDGTLVQYLGGYDDWIDFGVLWFVAALLLFTLIHVLVRVTFKQVLKPIPVPKALTIVIFAAGVGIVSFGVRLLFPVGWVLHPVGFQLGHFCQYIALFILGLVASKTNGLTPWMLKRVKAWAHLPVGCSCFFRCFLSSKKQHTWTEVGGMAGRISRRCCMPYGNS